MVQVLCGFGLVDGGPLGGELAGGEVAVGGMGSFPVVAGPPVLDDHSGFEEAVELPTVEQFVSEPAVERLDPCVLPRGAGIDEHARGVVEPAPVRERIRDEFGAVVHPQVCGRSTPLGSEPVEDFDDTVGVDGMIDLDREGFAGELVDHVQYLQGSPVRQGVELEVERPQHVRTNRAHRPDLDADAGETLLALLDRDAEAFVAPQASDTFVVHLTALTAGFLGGASPSPTRSTRGEVT